MVHFCINLKELHTRIVRTQFQSNSAILEILSFSCFSLVLVAKKIHSRIMLTLSSPKSIQDFSANGIPWSIIKMLKQCFQTKQTRAAGGHLRLLIPINLKELYLRISPTKFVQNPTWFLDVLAFEQNPSLKQKI